MADEKSNSAQIYIDNDVARMIRGDSRCADHSGVVATLNDVNRRLNKLDQRLVEQNKDFQKFQVDIKTDLKGVTTKISTMVLISTPIWVAIVSAIVYGITNR